MCRPCHYEAAVACTSVRTRGIGASCVRGTRVCSLQTLIDLDARLSIAIITRIALAIVCANGVNTSRIGMAAVVATAFVDVVASVNAIARKADVASTTVPTSTTRADGIDTMTVGGTKSGTGDGALVDVSARFAVAIETGGTCASV